MYKDNKDIYDDNVFQRQILELTNEFIKVKAYNINIQKSNIFLHLQWTFCKWHWENSIYSNIKE